MANRICHSKIIKFLWPPNDHQTHQKPLHHNNFSLYGIQEVSGSIPLISTKKFLNDKTKQAIAKVCVQFVEQVYKDIHGEEKLFAALERAAEILAEKGIEFSAVEMETLIEAAVAEFNEAFYKPVAAEKLLE